MNLDNYLDDLKRKKNNEIKICLNCKLETCIHDKGKKTGTCPLSKDYYMSSTIQQSCGVRVQDNPLPGVECNQTTINSRQIQYRRVRENI